MVMACIHIICGNCGNGDKSEMEFEVKRDFLEFEDRTEDDASITCKNCGTIHYFDEIKDRATNSSK
jgi:RNase P subunit RPR2